LRSLIVIRIEPVLGQFANVAAFPHRGAARHPTTVKSQRACPEVPVNIVKDEELFEDRYYDKKMHCTIKDKKNGSSTACTTQTVVGCAVGFAVWCGLVANDPDLARVVRRMRPPVGDRSTGVRSVALIRVAERMRVSGDACPLATLHFRDNTRTSCDP
jgi:hypothetical protein